MPLGMRTENGVGMVVSVQKIDAEILGLINKARTTLSMAPLEDLPSGVPNTSRLCVLGRSLGVEVLLDDKDYPFALVLNYRRGCALAKAWDVSPPTEAWNGWGVQLPAELAKFVRDFDAQQYPGLSLSTRAVDIGGIRSELRSLRFGWMEEHGRLERLLGQAREACDRAAQLRQRSLQKPVSKGHPAVGIELPRPLSSSRS